jgi:glycosyltransferase involved in cell wall biosynthesis
MIIVTDTFHQTNGVSTTYKNLKKIAKSRNLSFKVIHPSLFNWIPMPLYPEIQLSIQPFRLWKTLNRMNPPQIHIATEGIMGLVARIWCKIHKKPFTSSYHTRFPEYLNVMLGVPVSWSYSYLRQFHAAAKTTFVTTESVYKELSERGFKHLILWTRGVSEQLFSDYLPKTTSAKLRVLNVGRVSREKNLDALCTYQDQFEITIVGDGPYLAELKQKYQNVTFLGYKFGKELADIYAEHDIFAFPSCTDTFGIVMIEAMCNGLPVAGFDVAGPRDVIEHGVTGFYSNDLYLSIVHCQKLNRHNIKHSSRKKWCWSHCFDIFFNHFHA